MARARTIGQSPTGVMVSGRYYRCPNGSLSTNGSQGVGTMRAVPKYIPNTITVAKIGVEVASAGEAGAKVRLGIYADDGGYRPGALVVDSGQIAGDSATVQEITDGATVLYGGRWYWFASVVQSVVTTQPTMRVLSSLWEPTPIDHFTSAPPANSAYNCLYMVNVTGALASTFVVAGCTSTPPAIFIKVA